MKILLVDDSRKFLSGLKNMLESRGYEVAGMAHSASEALRLACTVAPDLVLMDIQMPGEDGISATRALKRAAPSLKIVMMTISDSDEHLFDSIVAGADGYLIKGEPEPFVEALSALTRGEVPFSPGLARRIMDEFARRSRPLASDIPNNDTKSELPNFDPPNSVPPNVDGAKPKEIRADAAMQHPAETNSDASGSAKKLTRRQHTILSKIADGLTYREIAGQLGITVATIDYHMAEIVSRLRVENRAQAIAYICSQKTATPQPRR